MTYAAMSMKPIEYLKSFNWLVLAGMAVLALALGALNNLRVDDEKRVMWLGGSMAAEDDSEDEP